MKASQGGSLADAPARLMALPEMNLSHFISSLMSPLNDPDIYEGCPELIQLFTEFYNVLQVFWSGPLSHLPEAKAYRERATRLKKDFHDTLFGADKMYQMLAEREFLEMVYSKWPDANLQWPDLLENRAFLKLSVDYWEDHYGRAQMDYRRGIYFAVMILRERSRLIGYHQESIDKIRAPAVDLRELIRQERRPGLLSRLVERIVRRFSSVDPEPETSEEVMAADLDEAEEMGNDPHELDLIDWKAGVSHLVRLSVEMVIEHVPVKRKINDFKEENSELLEGLGGLIDSDDFNRAIGFRLALCPYDPNHYDTGGILPYDEKYNPFNEGELVKRATRSALDLIKMIKEQEDPAAYLAEQNTIEVLGKARMEILLPSLQLAQRGGRIPWPHGAMDDVFLSTYLIQLNLVLGGVAFTVRPGGPHLAEQLRPQRALKERVAGDELYANDPEYDQWISAGYNMRVVSKDSYIISLDANPFYSAGQVLIDKIQADPPTYQIDFIYIDKDYRRNYHLGTVLQNIAESLVGHIPNARIVTTAHALNPHISRHFKRGFVGTGLTNYGKTIGLQIYRGGFIASTKETAQSHDHFMWLCEKFLSDEESHPPTAKEGYLLTGMEPESEGENFPCQVTFSKPKATPEAGFYKHGSL